MTSEELLHLLRRRDTDIVPFVGAGLAISAGAPATKTLAERLSERTEVPIGSLTNVVREAEKKVGRPEVKRIVAEVFRSTPTTPTPSMVALAQWPSRRILTTNYDLAIEGAIRRAGLRPRTFAGPSDADTLVLPPPGTVHVIHLHGVQTESESLVLPGRTTHALSSDEKFLNNVRALMQQSAMLYLGFSLGPGEFHLRSTLTWLTEIRNARRHLLLIPAPDEITRETDLEELAAIHQVEVIGYEPTEGDEHRFVRHAIAARAPRADVTGAVAALLHGESAPGYVPPAMVREDEDDDHEELQRKVWSAEGRWQGDDFVSQETLLETGPALVLASPGMGKSELLRVMAGNPGCGPALLTTVSEIANAVERPVETSGPHRTGDPLAVARALAQARSGLNDVPLPDIAALENTSYTLLLDGLDEVVPPERRLAATLAITAAAERWPQHRWIVAGRPNLEVTALTDAGFGTFRILPSRLWAEAYFEARGVPTERATWVREHQPGFADLLGVPLFAAHIANRLLEHAELPNTVVELIVDAQRAATEREARAYARNATDLGAYVTRLAVGLELRGRSQAKVEELASVPGHRDLAPLTIRERLVRASLLTQLPGTAELHRRSLQQALCAWSILGTPDPAATLRRVALGEVLGEQHLRSDMDYTIDLVFDAASREQRTQLREIDVERWARTVVSNGTVEDARVALTLLCNDAAERKVMFSNWSEGLRSPMGAALAIVTRWPVLIDERRSELLTELEAPERHRRANSALLLTCCRDPAAAEWLPQLVEDSDEFIQRLAVDATRAWRVRETIPALERAATGGRSRNSERILHALVDLADDQDEVLHLAGLVTDSHSGLRQIAGEIGQRLDLDGMLTLLGRRSFDFELWDWFLDRTLERATTDDWTDERVAMLIEAIIRHDRDPHLSVRPELAEIIAEHPATAVLAASKAVYHQPPVFRGLAVLARLDRHHLAGEDLATVRDGLARALAQEPDPPRPQPTDWDTEARRRLDDPTAEPRDVLTSQMRWRVEHLDDDQRDRLRHLAEEHWPTDDALRSINRHRRWDHELALGAVNAAAALELPLSDECWIALLQSPGVLESEQSAYTWLRRRYHPGLDEAIIAYVSQLDDGMHISSVIALMPREAHHVFDAIVDRLGSISTDSGGWNNAAGMLRDRQMADALRRLLAGGRTSKQRIEVADDLASLGDAEGQLISLDHLIEQVHDGQIERQRPHWPQSSPDPRVVSRLGDLLSALMPSHRNSELFSFGLGQLQVAETDDALRVLDGLRKQRDDASLALTRTALARRLATVDVLHRLPASLGDAAVLLDH